MIGNLLPHHSAAPVGGDGTSPVAQARPSEGGVAR
jgi:hypothetical protein